LDGLIRSVQQLYALLQEEMFIHVTSTAEVGLL